MKNKYIILKSDIAKSENDFENPNPPITKHIKQLIETIAKIKPITTKFEASTPHSSTVKRKKSNRDNQNLTPERDLQNIKDNIQDTEDIMKRINSLYHRYC